MKNAKKNFILIHILLLIFLILFLLFRYLGVKDISNLFLSTKIDKEISIFVIEKNSLKKKSLFLNYRDERDKIEKILKNLENNHKENLKISYIIKNVYINDNIYIPIKFKDNDLSEMEEILFIYSIVNSISNGKKIKFFNLGEKNLFKFVDENNFFEENKAFTEN